MDDEKLIIIDAEGLEDLLRGRGCEIDGIQINVSWDAWSVISDILLDIRDDAIREKYDHPPEID